MSSREAEKSVLAGTRVIDLTQALAGPYCTMLLGDLGADVIKVERPGTGEQSRGWGPPYLNGESAYFLSVNRNKRGLALNLKGAKAQKIMRKLVRTADVFVVNQPRLSSLQKLGIDYETLQKLNPRLVYCSITGYGMTGPHAGRPGYDVVIQGEAGLMSITGEIEGGPIRYPVPIADVTTGIYSALAIVTALLARERTGEGQFIDSSLLESQLSWLTNVGGNYFATGQRPPRLGNAHPTIVPYQPLKARDKYLIVGVGTERLWELFCEALGGQDALMTDPRFATNRDRLAHRDELIALLENILVEHDAAHWLELLGKAGIPCGPINFVDEILNEPHVRERGVIVELEHPAAGVVRSIANPVRLSATPVSYRLPPPMLGQHNKEILAELGFAPEREESGALPIVLQNLSASSISQTVNTSFRYRVWRGRVLSSFPAACNLIDESGRVVSLVIAAVGNGPLNVVVKEAATFDGLETGLEAVIEGEQIIVGERLAVNLQNAEEWNPVITWGKIEAKAMESLWNHLQEQATPKSLLTIWVPEVRPLRGAHMAFLETARNAAERLMLALHLGDKASIAVYVKSLAGLGPGGTPAGDDFLMGLVAGLRAWPQFLNAGGLLIEEACAIIGQAALEQTTAFSQAQLQAAQAGQMSEGWHQLAAAMAAGEETAIEKAANRLLALGATSGADALAGFVGPYLLAEL